MRRIVHISLFILMAVFALTFLSGCTKEDRISSVYLKDHDPNQVIEMELGCFDCKDYTLAVSYESGKVQELELTEDMIAGADVLKFYQIGEHDITVSYAKRTYVFKISVKRSTFGELSLPENNVFTYDGQAHTIELIGDIPANAIVTYVGGNSFVNAGTYDVTAIVSCEGYVTVRLYTTVKIERAKYDMSGITFEAKEYVYDGQAHSVQISGTLPEGVSAPTYIINEKIASSAVDAGEYTVTARFANKDPNYEAIPDMKTTLTITPAAYPLKDAALIFKTDKGEVLSKAQKTYDGSAVLFELKDYSKIAGKVSIVFSVYDESGKLISNSNKNTEIKNAGVYTVKVEFTPMDSKNYQPIEPLIRVFEVKKLKYDVSKIRFDNNAVVYDGEEHRLSVEIPNGHTIQAEDVTYEYYLDGKLVKRGADVGVSAVGEYVVKAIFTVKDENYEQIEPLEAILKIK